MGYYEKMGARRYERLQNIWDSNMSEDKKIDAIKAALDGYSVKQQ